ncbi:uncharacterized protein LOC131227211 [Magnolia sinica]|uniref:uncharacterized protein LOC131227211 n=1 Tax=Magnolia sinica TaxID=86752 RepID=UPI002658AD4A|nr:uncharacterized protein LOC131227211 [Magnolia sinica]
MGNGLSPCCTSTSKSSVNLVFWEGTTKTLTGKRLAGEVMFQFPDKIVCHADSFYIGHPIPSLSIDDELMKGQTYFVLPIDRFACQVLSAASLAALASTPKRTPLCFGECPFEYVKGTDGRVLIKVLPEFIIRILSRSSEQGSNPTTSPLISTPELQKHYAQLVGSKGQVWSPKLETIKECKTRSSSRTLLWLERRSGKFEG